MELLTEDFLNKYKDFEVPFTQLGKFVYYRTYSRWLEDKKRRENFLETAKRAVEYNVSLALKQKPTLDLEQLRQEAEQLFDNMVNLRQFLSGRTLWVGGTPVTEKFGLANYNCSGVVIDKLESFVDMFYLLLVGAGVGFRILKRDVEKLPKIKTYVELIHSPYSPVNKRDREDNTSIEFVNNVARIVVGDSKEGWVKALEFYLQILYQSAYRNIDTVIMVYDNVRPKGERLKTFGGTASGHESLKRMFEKIDMIIKKLGEETNQDLAKLRPIDCLDIANIIGENVVVGGVRRTSQIALFDSDDEEVLQAKSHLYYVDESGEYIENTNISHRRMSNNSIMFWEKPSREKLHGILNMIRYTGEPGFVNAESARKRNPYFELLNPCAEVLLSNYGLCNLVTLNVCAFIKDNKFDLDSALKAQRLNVRSALRITCIDLELPHWDAVQKTYRLLGVSLTGWQDMVDALNLTKEQQIEILKKLREVAHEEAKSYAKELGVNEPLLVTTIKPEGTLSLLPTVSAGIHNSYSRYYIRRVRINAHDPLCKVAERLNWVIHPEVGQSEENCNTKVIEFPVKSSAKVTRYEVSAIEQLERYKMFMEHYVDHNVSITVGVKPYEWEEVEQWLWDNWDYVVAITFIELDNAVYPLMPYEAITQEQYELLDSITQPFDEKLITEFELELNDAEIEDTTLGCEGGACPIR